MVTIITKVYNTKPYLRQCIESVLSQSYRDFKYVLVDNGCTDGSSGIIRDYARQDDRIRMVRFEENSQIPTLSMLNAHAEGDYAAVIDSDDWWEPDYLERLIRFSEAHQLDLALTGTVQYYEQSRTHKTLRLLEEPAILTRPQFARQYAKLWTFPSALWGNVMRTELLRRLPPLERTATYGGDTITMLKYLSLCGRIGIDGSALYHYRMREKSISSEFDDDRFMSNLYLRECIIEFLTKNGAFDEKKREWLKAAYMNMVADTAEALGRSALSDDRKLKKAREMAEHPVTRDALTGLEEPAAARGRRLLLSMALNRAGAAGDAARADMRAIVEALAPACAPAITTESIGLFAEEGLLEAVFADDAQALLTGALELIRAQRHTKKYDVCAVVRALSAETPLLRGLDDRKFLRRHGDIYLAIWRGQLAEALDALTGALLGGEKASEEVLRLYLSLAALMGQAEAFVFGKIKLAELFLRQADAAACRAQLEELEEMGAGDIGDVRVLRQKLER